MTKADIRRFVTANAHLTPPRLDWFNSRWVIIGTLSCWLQAQNGKWYLACAWAANECVDVHSDAEVRLRQGNVYRTLTWHLEQKLTTRTGLKQHRGWFRFKDVQPYEKAKAVSGKVAVLG